MESHNLSVVKRFLKGTTPTTAVSFTSVAPPTTSIKKTFSSPLPIRPFVPEPQCYKCQRMNHTFKTCRFTARCYHCGKQGLKEAKLHHVCCQKPQTPKCIHCPGNHFPAQKGCAARIQSVHEIHQKNGNRAQKAPNQTPVINCHNSPWKHATPPQVPVTLSKAEFPPLTNTLPNTMTEFPPLMKTTKTHTSVATPLKQAATPNTITVTAISNMQFLWQTIHAVESLLKTLPKDLYQKKDLPMCNRPPSQSKSCTQS